MHFVGMTLWMGMVVKLLLEVVVMVVEVVVED